MNLSQNITKKIKSFLAYRIFFIILILTTLPLLIYSIILYKTEYNQKKEEILQTNTILANQIKKNIQDNFNIKKQVLDLIYDEIKLGKINTDNYLAKIANQFNLQDIFYAVYQKDNLVIKNATKKQIINKNINFIREVLNNKNAFFKSERLMCFDCIYFSKTIFQNQKPTKIIVLSTKQDEFISVSKENFPPGVDVSVVDSFNKVIISTDKNLHYLDLKDNKKLIIKSRIDDTYVLVLSVNNKAVQLMHLKSYFFKHALVYSIVFLFLLLITFLIVRLLAKPVSSLLDTMQQIKMGNLEKRYQKHKMGFEINYLGGFFNEMMDSLIMKQKEIEKEKIEKQRYLGELQIAREIQESLLPDKTLDIKNIDVAFGSIFAKEVGGDFYDFIEKNGKIFFVIADIASKGILACLYALSLRSIIRSIATYFFDLEKIIIQTNKLFLKDSLKNFMFSTAFFGIFDTNTKKLEFANCGHMPAILKKQDGSLEFLTTKGRALGIEDFDEVQVKHITLKKDDLLFLYTDGIIDAINIDNKFFGEKNLHKFIKETKDIKTNQVIKNLFDKLKSYSKDVSQYDDIAIVVIKII